MGFSVSFLATLSVVVKLYDELIVNKLFSMMKDH